MQTFWLVPESDIVRVTEPVAVPAAAMLTPTAGVGAPAVAVNQEARHPASGVPAWVMLRLLEATSAETPVRA